MPEESHDLPELPPFEEEKTVDLPEPPSPDMPEAPAPKLNGESHDEEALPPFETKNYPELQEDVMPHEIIPTVDEPAMPAFEPREAVRKPVGPAFVSVDDYRAIMDQSNRVRDKLAESEQFVNRLHEIKSEEESVFEKWRAQLEDVERKLGAIDRVIAKAKR